MPNKETQKHFHYFIPTQNQPWKSTLEGHGVIVQMDVNIHAGQKLVKNDPHKQNTNGKYFERFLEDNPSLFVANNLEICEGTITRQRKVENKTEMAILDFFIMNEKMRPFLKRMFID